MWIIAKSQDKFSPEFPPENKSLAAMLVGHYYGTIPLWYQLKCARSLISFSKQWLIYINPNTIRQGKLTARLFSYLQD